MKRLSMLFLAVALLAPALRIQAAPALPQVRLTHPVGGAETGEFGHSIAVDGDWMVVSAPTSLQSDGLARVYRRDPSGQWEYEAELRGDTNSTLDPPMFGNSVAISGDTILVGALGQNAWKGACYVFTRGENGWSRQAKLTASDGQFGDCFGSRIALSGDTAAISAISDDDRGSSAGAVYIFTRLAGTWSQQTKLFGSDTNAGDNFGSGVALREDRLVVGAPEGNETPPYAPNGVAYVFRRSGSTWVQEARLLPTGESSGSGFGVCVAISDTFIACGAETDYERAPTSGAVFVFERNGEEWTATAKLKASDPLAGSLFGNEVAIQGNLLLVGAYADRSWTGAGYLFKSSGGSWAQLTKIVDLLDSDFFGSAVALAGKQAVIGAPGDFNSFDGSVTVVTLSPDYTVARNWTRY